MFQRFFDEGLAQASFLIGCDRTRKAVVIDPRRDTDIYLEAAKQLGATIVAAVETHVHERTRAVRGGRDHRSRCRARIPAPRGRRR